MRTSKGMRTSKSMHCDTALHVFSSTNYYMHTDTAPVTCIINNNETKKKIITIVKIMKTNRQTDLTSQ
jgi:hypothetical protein